MELRTTRGDWLRRALTCSVVLFGWPLATMLLPWALGLAVVVDLAVRRRGAWARTLLVMWWVLTCEALGLVAAAWLAAEHLVVGDRERFVARNYRLQAWWTGAIAAALRRVFGMSLTVDGAGHAGPGPVLVLVRHVSSADTLLPGLCIAAPAGLRLRYVLKHELLWDPCLDVVGHRTRNVFVRRGTGGSVDANHAIGALAHDLGPGDGVVIFPEGTRFTESKRRRLAAGTRTDLAGFARDHAEVLPPRSGGVLALLQAATEADVLFCAHTGLEGVTTMGHLFDGALIGRRVQVKLWRVPAAQIPKVPEARRTWLYDQWHAVDEWISTHRAR